MPADVDLELHIADQLDAHSLSRCSRWVERNRYMQGDLEGWWSFDLYPWLREPHDCSSNNLMMAIQKGAQLGWTEFALNRALFELVQEKRDVLYALPNATPDAGIFSKSRVNAALDANKKLKELFLKNNSESHKQTVFNTNLHIRGSRTPSPFRSIPVSLVILDEVDLMAAEQVELVWYRLSGQHVKKQLIMLSTPSIAGKGINVRYRDSDQRHFIFPCPHCSKLIELRWPDSFYLDDDPFKSYLKCYECDAELKHEEKKDFLANAYWEPMNPGPRMLGYYINQLYGSAMKPFEIAEVALKARLDTVANQEFHNSVLGETFQEEGAQVSDANIADCTRDYLNGDESQTKKRLLTMGVDVGQKVFHIWVSGWQMDPSVKSRDIIEKAVGRLIWSGTVETFEQVKDMIMKWRPRKIVIDAEPETRGAANLCNKFPKGLAFTCDYKKQKENREINKSAKNGADRLSVYRTFWLDATMSLIKSKRYEFPKDLPMDARQHLKSLVRTYREDANGDTKAHYEKLDGQEDHYAHAMNYSTIALALCAGSGEAVDG